MDRNRDARRTGVGLSNGLSRRRQHRSNNLRQDSPEEDGQVELQEAVRIRDRKKHRNRDRSNLMSKRRRSDCGGDESTGESVNDEEDEEFDDRVKMLPPMYSSPSVTNQHHQQHHQQSQNHRNRKSFSPAKNFKPVQPWLAAGDKICVSVPRKARSASTKRSHEYWASSGGGSGGSGIAGDQIPRQESTSPPPIRANLVSASPVSPSSSGISARKKMKSSNGHKQHRPAIKPLSKSSSSNQDEIEIEIAEVLYGMMRQPQGPSKQEIMATTTNESIPSGEVKSRVSSPISNMPSSVPSLLTQHSSSAAPPTGSIVPKRKKPRQVMSYNDENTARSTIPISFNTKQENDHHPSKNNGSPLPILEKNGGSGETGLTMNDLPNSKLVNPPPVKSPQENLKVENRSLSDLKPSNECPAKEVDAANLFEKNGSALLRFDGKSEDSNNLNSMKFGAETKREEKFQIDLMAPQFQMRLSPDRDGDVNYSTVEPKPIISQFESEKKHDLKPVNPSKDDLRTREPEEKKAKTTMENVKSQPIEGRFIDHHLDLDKIERDRTGGSGGFGASNFPQQQQLQPKLNGSHDEPPTSTEKTAPLSGSVPLQMSMGNWPGGLPPMGYMASPHHVVLPIDGTTVSPGTLQPPHAWPFAQQGTKRCATHCYIARAIHYNQRLQKINPYMPAGAAAAGAAPSLYGSKPGGLNLMPSPDLHGNIQGSRAVNSVHEKGQGVVMFPGHVGKDKGSQSSAVVMDAAHRKPQIVLQQALPPGAPGNILPGPAFIFPMSQPPAAPPSASLRPPGSLKSPATGASSNVSTSASAVGPQGGTPMSFNYPNMATTNDGQYLAIMQNGGYPFPIPAHVGGQAAAYRGNHPQPMPFFNGGYYTPQMLHPSQAQPQPQPTSQAPQNSQSHQTPTISSGSSSSHKHLQNLHQRPLGGSSGGGGGGNNGSGNLQGYSAAKSQPPQQQQQLNHQNQRLHLPRQLESEVGGEDSPSSADSRVSRANMNVYGQNFAMPMHPQNFALMTQHPASMSSTIGANEKKQQPQPQQLAQNQGLKGVGVESLSSPAFAMSFASFSAAAAANSAGFDMSSTGQNHTIVQNYPEAAAAAAARHGYHQIMAAAHASQQQQQKKTFRGSEEQKNGGHSSSSPHRDEERKSVAGKTQGSTGSQSIAFSRTDIPDTSGPTISVIDSSSRSLGLGMGSNKTVTNSQQQHHQQLQQQQQQQQQQQMQLQQQQQRQLQYQNHQQQMIQLQKQQQTNYVAAAARSKMPSTDHQSPSSSSMSAKFNNPLSAYPQNIVQNSAGPNQASQWKNSTRATTPSSQVPSPSVAAPTNSPSLKNIPQQHGRTQQQQNHHHTQISFANNMPKPSPQPSSQAPSPPPPMAVGSPTHSSMSRGSAGGGGSGSRTATVQSTGNKVAAAQVSALLPQQGKSLPAAAPRKSSPVGGRTVPSILGNKTQMQHQQAPQQVSQQQQPNQLAKQAMQQAQLLFSNPYMQNQAPNSPMLAGSTGSATSGYYAQQRRRPEQHHHQQPPSSQPQSSPVSVASPAPSDPAKAAVSSAASSNKIGNDESSTNPHQHVSAGLSYAHAVPTAVQVKATTEQTQPAGE